MGSYTELTINSYPIHSSKSYIPNISCIFCESDKKVFDRKVSERNKIIWGNIEEDDVETAYEYQTTVEIAIERLEILGYSLSKTKKDFIESKSKEVQEQNDFLEFPDEHSMNEFYTDKIRLLQSSSFEDFKKAFIELRVKKVPYYTTDKDYSISDLAKYLVDDGWVLNFPCSDFGFYYRAYLESCDKNALVIQDITEVVNAGYYNPEEEVITPIMKTQEKITILTEGPSDITILSKSIKLLYPHLFDYYNFKDFKVSNAQGSAHQLFLEVKALIAINHKENIIALFDNDGEGLKWFNELKKINIPKNFVVLVYPNIALLETYPTIENESKNLNGIAGSIEMYLGKDILKEKEGFIPVEINSQNTLHGVVKYKDNLQKKYYKKIKKCNSKTSSIDDYNWDEMKLLLREIFEAFK